MILSAVDLQREIKQGTLTIIPYNAETIRENGIDLRISQTIMRLNEKNEKALDIQNPNYDEFYFKENIVDNLILGKYERILVSTIEKITLPNNLMAFCQLRSTFARAGVSIPPTVVDAGFAGNLTIQLSCGPFPVKISINTRFLHLVFAELKTPLKSGYEGKYKNDCGVAAPKADKKIK